jgi:hypothetical protein
MASTPILDLSVNEEEKNISGEILPFLQRVFERKYDTSDPGIYEGGDFVLPATRGHAAELYEMAQSIVRDRRVGRTMATTYIIVYDWVIEMVGNTELHNLILLPMVYDWRTLPIRPDQIRRRQETDGLLLSTAVLTFVEEQSKQPIVEYLGLISILTFRFNGILDTLVATTRRDSPVQIFSPLTFHRKNNSPEPLHFPTRESLMNLIVTSTRPRNKNASIDLPQPLAALMTIASPYEVLQDIAKYTTPPNDPNRIANVVNLAEDVIELGWGRYSDFVVAMIDYETTVNKLPAIEARNLILRRISSGNAGPNDAEVIQLLIDKMSDDPAVIDILLDESLKRGYAKNAVTVLRNVGDWTSRVEAPRRRELLLAGALRDTDDKIVSAALTNLTVNGKFSSDQIRDALWIIGRSDHPSVNIERALENADAYGLIDPSTTRFESRNGVLLSLSEFAGTFGDLRTAGTVLQWALKNGAPYPRGPIVQSEWLETNEPLWNTVMSNMNTKRPIVDLVDDMFQPQ